MTNLLLPTQNANENPAIEFRPGQFLFKSTNQAGGHVDRLLSPAAVREAFTGIPIDSGWLPPEVVRWGTGRVGEWAIAFIRPQVYELELTNEKATDTNWKMETQVERIHTPLPGLVFFGFSNQYHVWAVKTDELKPDHEIYRCPLPNVEASGLICWGYYKPPRCTPKTILEAFQLFMRSTFNNHRCDGKSKGQKDDVRVALRELSGQCSVVKRGSVINRPASAQPDDLATDHRPLVTYPVDDLMRQMDHVGITLDRQIREIFEPAQSLGFSVLTEEDTDAVE